MYSYFNQLLLKFVLTKSAKFEPLYKQFESDNFVIVLFIAFYIVDVSQQLRPVCVSNFPGYVNFGAYLGIERKYFDIGAHYTLMSTGSRYSLEDYSGSLTIDALIVDRKSACRERV